MAELKDFFKNAEKRSGLAEKINATRSKDRESRKVFLTSVESEVLGGRGEKKKIDVFLKTPNLFAYDDLLNREFVDNDEIEFMVSVTDGSGKSVTGFFQKVPVFDVLFFDGEKSWKQRSKEFKDRVNSGSFFSFSRTSQGIFAGSYEVNNALNALKQVSDLVPVIHFPFASLEKLTSMGFVKNGGSEEYRKVLESLPESLDEPEVILVLDGDAESRIIESFKEKMNEYVSDVEKAISNAMKSRNYVVVVFETTPESQLFWEFYFLKEKIFRQKVLPVFKANIDREGKVDKMEDVIDDVASQGEVFTEVVLDLKNRYPQPYLYSGWLSFIANVVVFEPLEEVFNFIYRRYFSMIFSSAVAFMKLSDEVVNKRFVMVYDKNTILHFSSFYFEAVKAKKQAILERFESYRNVFDSVLQAM